MSMNHPKHSRMRSALAVGAALLISVSATAVARAADAVTLHAIFLPATWGTVVKNTLAELAGKGTPAEGVLKDLKGTHSIAYTRTDPVALAKALTKIAKDVPAFQFKSGVVEGRVISISEIKQLAEMPSKEELISKIMFLLNAPAQRIATALNALPRNLAVTVSEAVKANKFSS